MITTSENICVLKNYLLVPRPIFDTTYKGKKAGWKIHLNSTSQIGTITTK